MKVERERGREEDMENRPLSLSNTNYVLSAIIREKRALSLQHQSGRGTVQWGYPRHHVGGKNITSLILLYIFIKAIIIVIIFILTVF